MLVLKATKTNREDWSAVVVVDYSDTGSPVDITTATIVVAIKDELGNTTLGNVALVPTDDNNKFSFTFPLDIMRGLLAPHTYNFGITIDMSGITTQLFVGTLNVVDGVVP